MKKHFLCSFLCLLVFTISVAQTFTTPNTGVNWTLDDIAAASPSTISISGSEYTLLENLVISENDTVFIDSNLSLLVDQNLLLTVFGFFTISASSVLITALNNAAIFDGFRFEESSNINIQNTTISRSGGLRVLTENFILNNCEITQNETGATTSAVISLSRGMPQITNNIINFNQTAAIGSAINNDVSAYIFNNTIEGNNQENSNRPQINMGTTLANEPLQIIQNTIIGDAMLTQVGGIAIANFVGGTINLIVDNNTITGNRYGITVVGPSNDASITNNIIEDNNIQGDPLLGGSGINVNTATLGNNIIISGNQIRRNLWGITLQVMASINMGDDVDNPGQNIFADNGNSGEIFAIYNNTPNSIVAKHNCWIEGQQSTAQEVEAVIFHVVDDITLGEVIFEPFECGVLGIAENDRESFGFYPNPAINEIYLDADFLNGKVEIYGIEGNLIQTKFISEEDNIISLNLAAGIYFVKMSHENQNLTKKLIVE